VSDCFNSTAKGELLLRQITSLFIEKFQTIETAAAIASAKSLSRLPDRIEKITIVIIEPVELLAR
jgi:hypothetical protein